jgi:tetratricopeptide (TPR) repeat protein
LAAAWIGHAQWPRFAEFIDAGNRFEGVFFAPVVLPTGTVTARRPPREARAELTKLAEAAPAEADLYALRALESEKMLDFPQAESDWQRYAQLHADPFVGQMAMADFLHRRLRAPDELTALLAAARAPAAPAERFTPLANQRSWQAYQRAVELIRKQLLPADQFDLVAREWTARYPEAGAFEAAMAMLNAQGRPVDALLEAYQRQFPGRASFVRRARAGALSARGDAAGALALYASLPADAPAADWQAYLELLGSGAAFRAQLAESQKQFAATPANAAVAVKLMWLYRSAQQEGRAIRTLRDHQAAAGAQAAWATLGPWYEELGAFDDAARAYHALSLSGGAAAREAGLAALIRVLLTAPDQPVSIGAGDLALYRDMATTDPSPGALNAIGSLLFNSSDPRVAFDDLKQRAGAYQHRAKAAELLARLDRDFPQAAARAPLHAQLIAVYATYGDFDAVVREARAFRQSFPAAPERTNVSLALANALSRANQVNEELAVYDELLAELSRRSDGLPLSPAGAGVRSPDYVRVLDRALARLTQLKRQPQALALYRREIDRHPNDAGLYERFALYLDQNKLGAELEQAYRAAMQRFPGDDWSHKLARWYLRQRRTAQLESLTREVTGAFSGHQLERYFSAVIHSADVGPAMYLQLNLYAHQRFPHQLTFVRNLLSVYTARTSGNAAAAEALLRQHWFEAEDLRQRYFELLSRTDRLDRELAQLAPLAAREPLAARFVGEAHAWQTRFEQAAPVWERLADAFPADAVIARRAAMLHRSLDNPRVAGNIEARWSAYEPRDHEVRTRMGELYAEREQFDAARTVWEGIPRIEPGSEEAVIETATLYWDYFRFDDALRTIEQGRARLKRPELAAYEMGALYENQRRVERAIPEYVRAALANPEGPAQDRLVRLARRPALRALLDAQMAPVAAQSAAGARLRVALFEAQERRADLEAFLTQLASSRDPALLAQASAAAQTNGFPAVLERLALRQIELSGDPVDRLRAELDLVSLLESNGQGAAASRRMEDLWQANPQSPGVLRAAVNHFQRTQQPARAVAVLLEGASRAHPRLAGQLRWEAAQKAAEAKLFPVALETIAALRRSDPARIDYLLTAVDIQRRTGQAPAAAASLRQALEELPQTGASPAEREERGITLRLALIPVLLDLQDLNGAGDQWIEILNRRSLNEGLVRQAAAFARTTRQETKLTAFYEKAAADSPRDARWPAVRARLAAAFGDTAAQATYWKRAVALRPERLDWWTELGAAQERLMQFEAARDTYAKLYELSYRDPAWMARAAEQSMRLGRADEAVRTLREAYLTPNVARPGHFEWVAGKLMEWNQLEAAHAVVKEGLTAHRDWPGLRGLEADLAARLRRPLPPWSAERNEADLAVARRYGVAVERFFTPEEKSAAAAQWEQLRLRTPGDWLKLLLPLAESAGLVDVEARWRMLAAAGAPEESSYESRVSALQAQRGQFDELGRQLEQLAAAKPTKRAALLRMAQDAYESAGNPSAELRVLEALRASRELGDNRERSRYAELLARQATPRPTQDEALDLAVLNAAVEANRPAQAEQWLVSLAARRNAAWGSATRALLGLYFTQNTPGVRAAFESLLGPVTIGERLAAKPDPAREALGADWHYYAARYGDWLALSNAPEAEGWMLAEVERTPLRAARYRQLGDRLADAKQWANAEREYRYALQLGAHPADQARLAAALSAQQKPEAQEAWRDTLRAYTAAFTRGSRQLSLDQALNLLGGTPHAAALQAEVNEAVRAELRRGGGWASRETLRALYQLSPADGLGRILPLLPDLREPEAVLGLLVEQDWLPAAERATIHDRLVARWEALAAQRLGETRTQARVQTDSARVARLEFLLQSGQLDRARAALDALPARTREERQSEVRLLELQLAARRGEVGPLAERWTRDATWPRREELTDVAAQLERAGQTVAARRVLEAAYRRQIDTGDAADVAALGLAGLRLDSGDRPAAVALLRAGLAQSPAPAQFAADAGGLLLRRKQPEASEFLEQALRWSPWDPALQVRAAEAQLSASQNREAALQTLLRVGGSASFDYATRVEAALAWQKANGGAWPAGATELALLATSAAPGEAALKPYYFESRLVALRSAKDPAMRWRLASGALAIRPGSPVAREAFVQASVAAKRFRLALAALRESPEVSPALLPARIEALQSLGRYDEAADLAREWAQSAPPAQRPSAARTLSALERLAEVQRAQRPPHVTAGISQNDIVRPRATQLPPSARFPEGGAQ